MSLPGSCCRLRSNPQVASLAQAASVRHKSYKCMQHGARHARTAIGVVRVAIICSMAGILTPVMNPVPAWQRACSPVSPGLSLSHSAFSMGKAPFSPHSGGRLDLRPAPVSLRYVRFLNDCPKLGGSWSGKVIVPLKFRLYTNGPRASQALLKVPADSQDSAAAGCGGKLCCPHCCAVSCSAFDMHCRHGALTVCEATVEICLCRADLGGGGCRP